MAKLSDWINRANNTLDIANDVRDIARYTKDRVDYRRSGQYSYEKKNAEKYNDTGILIFKIAIVLWIIMVIGTIGLCIAGNDMILEFFSL